ncbi:Spy/CpxP family protein refolding chaperone [Acetobacter tropicalis]|uniref:Uncharacterized protein n=3 Tax=Acetobacter TaxID=434 RepID=A0A0U5EVT1_9PROT|nr:MULTISPECIES: periplasmic heavy metal sensor [Acetobacter]MCG4252346.1 Spy/CpxP family protein refolding chaperone [Acetobacter senegalensis]MCG4258229.1 Spy/CpxP family protein refolding chaperone [Acetobacter senegalensis]MCG4259746.1 Spy/CpxP family protein refolding chaperone [Acetobacter senegalensis]MCG4268156.1 Spy/CpxP family protein refolding chaperone [Acetobacter senegalensis]MCP1196980.1 Spy/CpxP family protein refolding chaperone [Acetobacter senegalensis]
MKKALLATALTFGMFTAAGSLARADDTSAPPPPPPPHHGMCHPHGHILSLDGVKLTSSQKKKIKAIMEANRPDPKADMEQERSIHEQIRTLLTTPGQVDTNQLTALTQQLDTLRTNRETQHLQKEVQIHDVLTKKQLAQIAAKKEDEHCPPPPPPPADGNPPPAPTTNQ